MLLTKFSLVLHKLLIALFPLLLSQKRLRGRVTVTASACLSCSISACAQGGALVISRPHYLTQNLGQRDPVSAKGDEVPSCAVFCGLHPVLLFIHLYALPDSWPYHYGVRKGTESNSVESWIKPHRQAEATIRSWFWPQECSRKRSQHLTGRGGVAEVEVRGDGISKDDNNTGPQVIFSI